MTWSRFDDAARKNPKAVAAGNEAWALWSAAVMYCNQHLTDGYVSVQALADECLPVKIPASKARKLAEKLCGARVRPDKMGLFERVDDNTYRVHDFLQWNPSKEDVEKKREVDRDRKRGSRSGGGGDGNPGGVPAESARNPDGVPPESGRSPAGSETESTRSPGGVPALARVPAPAGARVPSPPSPPSHPEGRSETTTTKTLDQERSSGTVRVAAVVAGDQDSRIPCPIDLDLLPEQRDSIEMSIGIAGWAVDHYRVPWAAGEAGDPSKTMTVVQWRKCLLQHITAKWSDSSRRPKKPQPVTDQNANELGIPGVVFGAGDLQ